MNIFRKAATGLCILPLLILAFSASAQHQGMQYYRPNDQRGINVFETTKDDTTAFHHLKVKVGGNFEQSYQMLRDKNTALPMTEAYHVSPDVSAVCVE